MPWKTTSQKEQRWRFIQEYLRRKTALSVLSGRWGISRKTAYKWIGRFKERGRLGLADGLHVAHRVFNRPSARWLSRIRRWRSRHPHWGAPKLHWALKRRFGPRGLPSESAISRWLKKWKLTRKRHRLAHKGPVISRPPLTVARQANDVWTVDFKGWFLTGDGTRVEPLTVRDLASRYILAVDLLERQTSWRRLSFERIFRQTGLPQVIRVDNGSPFGATGALGADAFERLVVQIGHSGGVH